MLQYTQRPRGLFGKTRVPLDGLPGPNPGYGGGTWNIDGTQATPVGGGMFEPSGPMASASGFPTVKTYTPDSPPPGAEPQLPDSSNLPMLPTGGNPRTHPQPSPFGATAMGDLSTLPRRGASQPYDYNSVMTSLLPPEKKRSTLEKIASIAIPALMGASGNQAGATAFISRLRGQRDEREKRRFDIQSNVARWQHEDWAHQRDADLRASAPRVIGRSMVQYDPENGGVSQLYDGPEDFETYAETMGLEPGTREYFDAVEDYVLKSDGPSAYQRDLGRDDYRTGNRVKLEGVRQDNRMGLEDVRQNNRVTTRALPTYRDTHPRVAGGGGSARPTATGPNGQKVEWNGSAWVPAN